MTVARRRAEGRPRSEDDDGDGDKGSRRERAIPIAFFHAEKYTDRIEARVAFSRKRRNSSSPRRVSVAVRSHYRSIDASASIPLELGSRYVN